MSWYQVLVRLVTGPLRAKSPDVPGDRLLYIYIYIY